MTDTIGYARLVAMLRKAAENVRAKESELSRLDSFGGDGDHGTTMVRAMRKLEETIHGALGEDAKLMLYDVGWAIMGVDGGATGPLFGSLFMAMSECAPDGPIDAATFAEMLGAGLAGVRKNTRASVGDKTMLDALVPAVEAFVAAADGEINDALDAAAKAAAEGAKSTKELAARFGRAKNLGSKSKGERDPGAASVALIFRGFSEGGRNLG